MSKSTPRIDQHRSIAINYETLRVYNQDNLYDKFIDMLKFAHQSDDPVCFNGKKLSEISIIDVVEDYGMFFNDVASVPLFSHKFSELPTDYGVIKSLIANDPSVIDEGKSLCERLGSGSGMLSNHIRGVLNCYGQYRDTVLSNDGDLGSMPLLTQSDLHGTNNHPTYLDSKIPVLYEKCVDAGVDIGAVIRFMSFMTADFGYGGFFTSDSGWEEVKPEPVLMENEKVKNDQDKNISNLLKDELRVEVKKAIANLIISKSPSLSEKGIRFDTPIDAITCMQALIDDFNVSWYRDSNTVYIPISWGKIDDSATQHRILAEVADEVNQFLDNVDSITGDDLRSKKLGTYIEEGNFSDSHFDHPATSTISLELILSDPSTGTMLNEIGSFKNMIDVLVDTTASIIKNHGSVANFISKMLEFVSGKDDQCHKECTKTLFQFKDQYIAAIVKDLNGMNLTFNGNTLYESYDGATIAHLFKDAPMIDSVFCTMRHIVIQFKEETYPMMYKLLY